MYRSGAQGRSLGWSHICGTIQIEVEKMRPECESVLL